ncbi:hypothetical protein DFH07DRAFT_990956 [Mycena maculata]|uniref:Cytochrome P450 n=1 Tax=Mycena maculata TaxID=230809 RepID=A0AAD7I079_9AGAR|nr:hypothetical protein DFH07DRAFT_990956 [Mycena maculata]
MYSASFYVETTSSATAWALYALSVNTAAQTKLREALLAIATDNPTMDKLNSPPYLEHVVRETMIQIKFVCVGRKVADCVLLMSLDKKEVVPVDTHVHQIAIKHYGLKGSLTSKATMTPKLYEKINSRLVKADDSHSYSGRQYGQRNLGGRCGQIQVRLERLSVRDVDLPSVGRPGRWEKIPDSVSAIPGVWANLLTFFSGPHNCIGFRFPLAEMKALLFTLVRAFELEQAVPQGGIGPAVSSLLQSPMVLAGGKGLGLPLIVKLYNTQL